MRKKAAQGVLAVICCLAVMAGCFTTAFAANKSVENLDPYQRLVITLLYENIKNAVDDYYAGSPRGLELYNASLTNLESTEGWSHFRVTVEVGTFYGPHNPPYALEIMTFGIALGKEPVLLEYEHIDEME